MLLTGCTQRYSSEVTAELDDLDDIMSRKEAIEAAKEREIDSIKRNLNSYTNVYEQYQRLTDVYKAYQRYHADSTRHYAEIKWNLANDAHIDSLSNDAALDIITLNTLSGFYTEAVFQLKDIDTIKLEKKQLSKFYDASITFYESMWVADRPGYNNQKYFRSLMRARGRYLSHSDSSNVEHLIQKTQLAYQTKQDSTLYIDEITERLNNDASLDYNQKSILAYLLYNGYEQLDDRQTALIYLIRSVKYDILAPVREHKPLYDLSAELYKMGDIDRAYKYIDVGMRDLFKTKVRVQMQYVENLFPAILHSYNQHKDLDKTRMKYLSITIAVALLMLLIAYITIWKEKQNVNLANIKVVKMNDELNKTNERLNKMNQMILASDNTKDIYIAQYLNMSLSYINQMDKFRNMLLNVARNKTKQDVIDILKSSTAINNELSFFYDNFDKAFLHLFPNFVEEFNALLQKDARFVIEKGKPLNTEIRVYALIRLGICDSAKIAEFLRRSVSTIYNYRVKLRNSALSNRDDFDKQVQNIGKLN